MGYTFIAIVTIIYIILGVRWGIRFVDQRWEALEQPNRRWLKLLVSIVIGITLGILFFALRAMKLIFHDIPNGFR